MNVIRRIIGVRRHFGFYPDYNKFRRQEQGMRMEEGGGI